MENTFFCLKFSTFDCMCENMKTEKSKKILIRIFILCNTHFKRSIRVYLKILIRVCPT